MIIKVLKVSYFICIMSGLKIFPSILNKDSIGDTVSQSLLMDDISDNFFL